jgi:hypothetical protein
MYKNGKIRNLLGLRGGTILMVCFIFSAGLIVKESGILNPGPLSAVQAQGEPLNGYTSHADFEQQCSHCHAPLHCITDSRCQDCHMEIAKERTTSEGLHSRLPGTDRCQDCHTEHMGRETVITELAFANLDHASLTGYSLVAHQQDYAGNPLNCESCHLQDRFIDQTLDCITCHSQENPEYIEQHRYEYGDDCIQCHDGQDRMMAFDHNQVYALDGGHAEVACADCHPNHTYTGVTQSCVSCHEDPVVHQGEFGLECERCHTAQNWTDAKLVKHIFPLDHGGEGTSECQVCHSGTYTINTCYGCHDHTPEDMLAVHQELGIQDYENCMTCHPTGVEGEADRIMKNLANLQTNPALDQPENSASQQAIGWQLGTGKGWETYEENSIQPDNPEQSADSGTAGTGAGR